MDLKLPVSKQMLVAWLTAAVSLFKLIGVDLPMDTILMLFDKIAELFNSENVAAIVGLFISLKMALLRIVTDSPLRTGWLGKLFGLRPE